MEVAGLFSLGRNALIIAHHTAAFHNNVYVFHSSVPMQYSAPHLLKIVVALLPQIFFIFSLDF